MKIVNFFFLISFLILIVVLLLGYLVFQDAQDIRQNYLSSNKLFLLTDGNQILTGIFVIEDETVFIDENQVNEFSNYLSNDDFDSLLNDNYKFMLIDLEILNELDEEFDILDQKVSREELFEIFRSDEPFEALTGQKKTGKILINDQEIEVDNIKFKGFLLVTLLANKLLQNPVQMIFFYKDGYLMIYPETILFKFVKNIPKAFVNQITAQVVAK